MFVRIWLKGTHWNITIRHAITNRPSKAASLDRSMFTSILRGKDEVKMAA